MSEWDYEVPSQPDATFGTADMDDASLANFFSRPIKIASFNDTPGSSIFQQFNPWSLFFDNPRIINRICNFNLLRAKLHVKFLINGNSFYFGRYLASYRPLPLNDNITLNRIASTGDIIEATQRPHVYIDPCQSQGGTLVLPFVWPYNALSIPDAEWSLMGDIDLQSITSLQHANAATTPLTISVFAWAEDVQLSIPTSVEPFTLTPQSGSEYTTGPISTPAAVVARAARALINIPYIGPYAKASEMVSSTVAAVAKMFGFSRPVVISEIQSFRPTFGNYANSNVPDNCHKLTLDVKQEVCVDSRVVGLAGHDEMTLKSIATRESYLTNFVWQTANSVEDRLFTIRVAPSMWYDTGGEYHIIPSTFAALPFKYWRGSMKYRFQVWGSGYHKGRLKLVWDPNYSTGTEYNVNYIKIIDISQDKDFTVTIGWGHPRPFLEVASLGGYTPFTTVVPLPGSELRTTNGMLSVYVVNELTLPNSAAVQDIQVGVFVSACDDFEVAVPTDCNIKDYSVLEPPAPGFLLDSPLDPQSAPGDGIALPDDSKPISDVGQTFSANLLGTDQIYSVVFGDPVGSARQLVKRYSLHRYLFGGAVTPTVPAIVRWYNPDFPTYRGTVSANGLHVGGTKNYTRNSFVNWFTPAYVCRRGGIRWKYMATHNVATGAAANVFIVKREPCITAFSRVATSFPVTTDGLAQAVQSFPGSNDGAQVNPIGPVPVAEVELPFYTNRRFWSGRSTATNNDPGFNTTQFHSFTMGTPATQNSAAIMYVAGADDFDLSFFLSTPIIYNIGTIA